jgi:hypothetical protein
MPCQSHPPRLYLLRSTGYGTLHYAISHRHVATYLFETLYYRPEGFVLLLNPAFCDVIILSYDWGWDWVSWNETTTGTNARASHRCPHDGVKPKCTGKKICSTVTRSNINPQNGTTLGLNPDSDVGSMWLTTWTMTESRTILKQPRFVNWKD